jgi:hypothetical protein
MAFLDMPAQQQDVTSKDFVAWVDKYFRFPSLPCEDQLTGLDLYGARFGVLHTYSIISNLSRNGKCGRWGIQT